MGDTQSNKKSPHDLFREIDDLCGEIDKALPNGAQQSGITEIQGVRIIFSLL